MKIYSKRKDSEAFKGLKKTKNMITNNEIGSGKPKKKKEESISFRPDEQVLEMLLAALGPKEERGKKRGLQSQWINESLRRALPSVVETWFALQREEQEKIVQRLSKHKKPNKNL